MSLLTEQEVTLRYGFNMKVGGTNSIALTSPSDLVPAFEGA